MKKIFSKQLLKKVAALLLSIHLFLFSLFPFIQTPFGPPEVSAEDQCSASPSSQQVNYQARVGGVALDMAAKFLADMSDITGAYYDQNLDRIVFVGKKNTTLPKFDRDDMAVAIKAVIFNRSIPAVSMEKDPSDPNGPNNLVLYYGGIENTRFGKILFDADYKLKLYGLGYDQNGQKLTSSVTGYKSFFDRYIEKGPNLNLPGSSRFWITPRLISLKNDNTNNAFVFEDAKMEVKTEGLVPDNDPAWNEAALEFAQQQSNLYDQFALETPVYAEAKQLGKIVSVIKWLYDNDIPSDFHWARDYAPKIVSTPTSVPKVYTPWINLPQGSIQLYGGVDYSTPNTYQSDPTGESNQIKTASQTIPTTKEDITWNFTKDGQQYEAVAVSADAFRSIGSYNQTEVDMSFPTAGDLNLTFQRTYSSFSGGQYGVGRGWNIFPAMLMDNNVGTTVSCSTGLTGTHPKALGFQSQQGGWESFSFKDCTAGYVAEDPSYHSKVFHNSDGTFTVRLATQVEYIFTIDYKLAKIKDKNGNSISYVYDSGGKLINISDGKNHQITLAYNPQGWINSISDWSGRSVKYTYDDQGSLLSVTDLSNSVTSYTYDQNFKLTSIKNREGTITLENSYSSKAKLTSQKDSSGLASNYAYDDTTRTITASDNLGRIQKAIYDTKARVLEKIDPILKSIKYTYGIERSPLTVTDKNGNKVIDTYDVNGNLTSITYPDGKKVSYTYDSKNRITKILDGRYGTTTKQSTFAYDALGNQTQKNEAGNTYSYTYDASGEMLTATNPLSQKTSWTRDSFGNALTTVDPLANTLSFAYDSITRPIKKTDPDGKISAYEYDANSNLTKIIDAAGTITNQYDRENRLIKTILPTSAITNYQYDPGGALTQVSDALENSTLYGYDAYKNLVSQKDSLDHTTNYLYDQLNRQTQSTTPLGKVSKWEYDANGNITKRTDANGNTTTYTYDALNRLIKITYPDLKTINNTYDNRGNLIKMVDPIGTTTYTYDNFDRMIKAINPHGKSISYTYDKNDNLTKLIYPDGKAATYSYFSNGLLKSVTDWNFKATNYIYNKNGAVSSRTLPNGIKTTYVYDSANRLSEVKHEKSTSVLAKFAYERDAIGNITKAIEEGTFFPSSTPISTPSATPKPTLSPSPTSIPSSSPIPTSTPISSSSPSPSPSATPASGTDIAIISVTTTPTSPSPGQTFKITTAVKNLGTIAVTDKLLKFAFYYDIPQSPTYQTSYNDFDLLSVTLAPGETKSYDFNYGQFPNSGPHSIYVIVDQENVLIENNENNNIFGPTNITVAYVGVLNRALAFIKSDPLNIIKVQTVHAQTQLPQFITNFSYDLLGRLKTAIYPDNSYSYTFDKVDNRLTETKNSEVTNYSFDADNKLIQGGPLSYYYDGNGNLTTRTQIYLLKNVQLTYDFENRLTKYVMENNNTYNYTYDGAGNRLQKEFSTAVTRYVYDTSGPISRLLTDVSGDANLYGLGLVSSGDTSASFREYILEDGTGNPRFLTKYTGDKKVTNNFDPFGNIRSTSGLASINQQYKNELLDDESGYYFLRARYYDPTTGRFITRDPISGTLTNAQTQNPYAFALNNPITNHDPSGEQAFSIIQNIATKCAQVLCGNDGDCFNELVATYNELKPLANQVGLEAHHAVEKRFGPTLGLKSQEFLSAGLDPETHPQVTALWRNAIGYIGDKVSITTANATPQDIQAAAIDIYTKLNLPHVLEAAKQTLLGL